MKRKVETYTVDGKIIEYSIVGEGGEPVFVMHGHSVVSVEHAYYAHQQIADS